MGKGGQDRLWWWWEVGRSGQNQSAVFSKVYNLIHSLVDPQFGCYRQIQHTNTQAAHKRKSRRVGGWGVSRFVGVGVGRGTYVANVT